MDEVDLVDQLLNPEPWFPTDYGSLITGNVFLSPVFNLHVPDGKKAGGKV